MAEVAIKRVNFFDGQFLKQGEFLELDLYHRHMHRRMLYMMFDRSGVVQLGPTDLALEVANAPTKDIRVKAGTALGKRDDQVEAKEVVLAADRVLNLNTTPTLGGVAFGGADVVVVTIHYDEQPTDPSSLGGVTGNTRIAESPVVSLHRAPLAVTNAPNGEPYITLGGFVWSSLALAGTRDVAFLKSSLLAATPTVSLSPNQAAAGTTTTIALSSVALSLTGLVSGDVIISPAAGIAVAVTSSAVNSATINVTVPAAAPPGPYTVTVKGVAATTTLTVNAGLAVTGAGTVAEPADTTWEINGSGFTDPATVQFTTSGGAASIVVGGGGVPGSSVTPTQLRIPLSQFNVDLYDNVIQGPVTVTCGGFTSAPSPSVTPPPRIKSAPASVAQGAVLTLGGRRFFAPVSVTVNGTAIAGFPRGGLGETRTDTQLQILIAAATPPGARVVVVGTAAGSVQQTVTVTP
jgi:hypothetical protein